MKLGARTSVRFTVQTLRAFEFCRRAIFSVRGNIQNYPAIGPARCSKLTKVRAATASLRLTNMSGGSYESCFAPLF